MVVAPVGQGVVNDRLTAIGTGQAVRTVSMRPLVAGQIAEIPVTSGARVDAGDVIIRLDSAEEELSVEYRDGSTLHVPIDQGHLLSRYVGVGGKAPLLSRLGDGRWSKVRKSAESAIMDYAARLLRTHAEREAQRVRPARAVANDEHIALTRREAPPQQRRESLQLELGRVGIASESGQSPG
mgnify:CR=1 FL=1